MYACLDVTCHLHFWWNNSGLLHSTLVTHGWNGHHMKISTESELWRRTFSCHSCWVLDPCPLDHKSGSLPTGYWTLDLWITNLVLYQLGTEPTTSGSQIRRSTNWALLTPVIGDRYCWWVDHCIARPLLNKICPVATASLALMQNHNKTAGWWLVSGCRMHTCKF